MLSIYKRGIILEHTNLEFENQAVLNPACFLKDNIVHLFYRAVRQGNYSSIGYAQFSYPDHELLYRATEPLLKPELEFESHGLEDPRITCLDGQYYLTYTAYDGHNTCVCYAVAESLPDKPESPVFRKQSRLTPALTISEIEELCKKDDNQESDICEIWNFQKQLPTGDSKYMWDKDGILFPERFNEKVAFLHRLRPNIQLIYCRNLSQLNPEISDDAWEENLESLEKYTVLEQDHDYENGYVGGGCSPLKTDLGWLLIYHAVERKDGNNIYRAAVALLDKHQPTRLVAKLPYPLFSPTEIWELSGDVNNVVFPTGAFIADGLVHIYYGAADKCIGYATVELAPLLSELKQNMRPVSLEKYQEIRIKPWGQEIVVTPESLDRVGKLIMVQAGKRLSLQYHDEKEETLCLISGEAVIWVQESLSSEPHCIKMQTNKGYTVPVGLIHRIEAVTDCTLMEVSSIETGTTYRLEDDFSRIDEVN